MIIFIFAILAFIAYGSLSSRISRLEKQLDAVSANTPQTSSVKESASISVNEQASDVREYAVSNTDQTQHEQSWVAPIQTPDDIIVSDGVASNSTSATSESSVGGTWFTAVGALAVLVAAGYFVRYAIDSGWITEPMRVALALLTGVACIAAGSYLRGSYATYAGIVAGLGLSLVYLGLFSAGAFYGLVSAAFALTCVAIVAIGGAYLATRLESQLLLAVSFVGAYLIPFMFNRSELYGVSIPLYAATVAIGIAVATYRRAWKSAAIVALMGAYAVSALWIIDGTFAGTSPDRAVTLVALSGLFLAFSAATLALYIKHGTEFDDRDAALVAVNAFGFLGTFLLAAGDMSYAGGVTFFLGVLHALAWWMVKGSEERASRYRYVLGGIALSMFALFVPIQFDSYVVSLSWSALAFVAAIVAARTDSPVARWFSGAIFTMAFLRLVIYEVTLTIGDGYGAALFNERVFVFAANAAAMLASAYLVRTAYRPTRALPDLLSLYGFFALFVVLHVEFARINNSDAWFAASAAMLAAIAAIWGIVHNLTATRYLGYITSASYAFAYVVGLGQTTERVFAINLRTIAGVVIAGAAAVTALVLRASPAIAPAERGSMAKLVGVFANFVLLSALTTDVLDVVSDPQTRLYAVSVLWLCYAVTALFIGIAFRFPGVRMAAVVLLSVVVLKVFLVDVANLDDLYRFLSYGTLGAILLGVGYAYNRYKSRIDGFLTGERVDN